MSSDQFQQRMYDEFRSFFDKAEVERRWNPYRDVPWDRVRSDTPEELAVCAETFLGVESYLPDYIRGALTSVRMSSTGQRWFAANWGYEELKHSIGLIEYLLRSGKRTMEQVHDFQEALMAKEWDRPHKTGRRMSIYAALQEKATFVIYLRHEAIAKKHEDEALACLYRLIARDECAHARFYEDATRAYLEEDREGTLHDLALVAANFQMPGVDLVPDYDARIEVMRREGNMTRDVFFQKVYFPVLKYLGVSRAELVSAAKAARKAEVHDVLAT